MTTRLPGRHTVDSINSDQLDDLQYRLQRAEAERDRLAVALAEYTGLPVHEVLAEARAAAVRAAEGSGR